jgi:chemotaxis protein CheD
MLKTRVIVNVSDAKASGDQSTVLVTHSLGSCIGVCLYDASTKVGGMLHYQLPDSKQDPERAKQKPLMFADTGMKLLLDKLISMGGNKKRMSIKICGGAAMDIGPKGFDIGKRNHLAIRKVLWRNGMFIDAEDVGGSSPRNMYLNIENGAVSVKSNGIDKAL